MKTLTTLTQKKHFNMLQFFSIFIIAMLSFSPIYGQQVDVNTRTIKGLVTSEDGPLQDVNIVQSNTSNGTVTNAKGEFTFPVKLKTGDVLIFSYLGYETQKVIIEANTSFITLSLNPDLVEMMGSLDANVPYASKRKN